MSDLHVGVQLGAYVLGILDPDECDTVESHLETCTACQEELTELSEAHELLAVLPEEMFEDQAGPDDELVLQRTLREIRTERGRGRRWRVTSAAAGVAVVAAAALGAGMLLGHDNSTAQPSALRHSAPASTPAGGPSTPAGGPSTLAGRTVTAVDATTHARMTATVTPAAGWARLEVRVAGVPKGERCRLVAVSSRGEQEIGGSWQVSAAGAGAAGTRVLGSVAIPTEDLRELRVLTVGGRHLVTAQL